MSRTSVPKNHIHLVVAEDRLTLPTMSARRDLSTSVLSVPFRDFAHPVTRYSSPSPGLVSILMSFIEPSSHKMAEGSKNLRNMAMIETIKNTTATG